jgi:hypothetical protein
MHVTNKEGNDGWPLQGQGGKDRVSFGMNMQKEEDSANSGSVLEKDATKMTAVERFHE